MAEPRKFTVADDDDGIRLDRWFKRHLPDVSFNIVSRWSRTGQLRVNGKRATPGDRIEAGQTIQFPPADAMPARTAKPERKREPLTEEETELVREMVIYEDPTRSSSTSRPGLATQGGTKTHHHLDRLLDGLADDAAAGRSSSTGWTRTRRARCWSRRRRGRRGISPSPFPDARRARSIGRSSSACPRWTKA